MDQIKDRARPSIRTLQVIVALFIVVKLRLLLSPELIDDEAYYWMWGQHPALSYFDHPPLHAWALGAVSLVFGWSTFALRVLTLFTLAGVAAILWVWAGRLDPDDRIRAFWLSLVVFLASPLFLAFSTVAAHDHLLILLTMLSINFFALYFADGRAGKSPLAYLYLGAIFLGLAVLTKYNGVFAGFGVGIYVLFSKNRWTHLKNPHLYLAALLAIAMQAPVLYWNVTEGFASFQFHLVDRHNVISPRFFTRAFVQNSVLAVSPFLFIAYFLAARRKWSGGPAATGTAIAFSIFAASTVFFLVLSVYVSLFEYWNIVAFIGLFPFAARAMGGGKLFWAHTVYGLLAAILLVITYTVVPVHVMFGKTHVSQWTYGWNEEIVTEARRLQTEYQPDFMAGVTYREAAQLGFQLKTSGFATLDERPDQFEFWFDHEAHRDQDALVLLGGSRSIEYAAEQFETFEKVSAIDVNRFGYLMRTYSFYVGRGYRGAAQDP